MTNRLQKIEKAINNMSDDKFNELLNELGIQEDKQWVPEYNEDYYYVLGGGDIHNTFWKNDTYDNYRLLMNNVFESPREAKAQRDFNIEKAKLIKEIEDSSDVIDWENEKQGNYYLYLSYYKNQKVLTIGGRAYIQSEGTIHTTNKEFLENLIKNEPERIKKYLFGIGE